MSKTIAQCINESFGADEAFVKFVESLPDENHYLLSYFRGTEHEHSPTFYSDFLAYVDFPDAGIPCNMIIVFIVCLFLLIELVRIGFFKYWTNHFPDNFIVVFSVFYK